MVLASKEVLEGLRTELRCASASVSGREPQEPAPPRASLPDMQRCSKGHWIAVRDSSGRTSPQMQRYLSQCASAADREVRGSV